MLLNSPIARPGNFFVGQKVKPFTFLGSLHIIDYDSHTLIRCLLSLLLGWLSEVPGVRAPA